MNILFTASEFYPLARTGGLGDVISALPAALTRRGHTVSVALPYYRCIKESKIKIKDLNLTLSIPLGNHLLPAHIYEAETEEGVQIFLIRKDEFFDRSELYLNDLGDYQDNAERFIFFSKAAVEVAKRMDPLPDVIHAHDWQTGLVPAFVKAQGLPFPTIFTIHNLAYQGSFWGFDFDYCNLPGDYFTPHGVEFYGHLNCVKGGILLADQVTTVSPTYAQEIQTSEFGCGLDQVLLENAKKLTGILNGIDETVWNPQKDPYLNKNYSHKSLLGKKECRKTLLKKVKWPEDNRECLIGIVSRFAWQKGMDLLQKAWPKMEKLPIRLIVLGSGDPDIEKWFRATAKLFPDKLHVTIGYDDKLAHQIEAGCDLFLMPSRYEPCGLNQMYSQIYGTLPVVYGTGGLLDTVNDYDSNPKKGNGFIFDSHSTKSFLDALQRALKLYSSPRKWTPVVKRAMQQDFSWERVASKYEEVYQRA